MDRSDLYNYTSDVQKEIADWASKRFSDERIQNAIIVGAHEAANKLMRKIEAQLFDRKV